MLVLFLFFFFQAEDGIRYGTVTGVQTCALPISGTSTRATPGLLEREGEWFVGTGRSPGRRIRPVAQTCAGGMQCAGEGRPMTLTSDELQLLESWWRAANYLTVGQIYLQANPLLREPLQPGHIKPRLLGHWGTSPGINLVWAHLNRLIVQRDQKALLLVGPGHGGPAANANAWLEVTWSELYRDV